MKQRDREKQKERERDKDNLRDSEGDRERIRWEGERGWEGRGGGLGKGVGDTTRCLIYLAAVSCIICYYCCVLWCCADMLIFLGICQQT